VSGNGALGDIHVLDFSRVLAGPFATMMLGDLGATVVKVERPGSGDDTRAWGPPHDADGQATYFQAVNRNKRSIALDLEDPGDVRRALQLAEGSDVVVENFRPGVLDRLGRAPASPCTLQVVEAHEPAAAVHDHPDGVEPDRLCGRPASGGNLPAEPGDRQAPQPRPLAVAQPAQRLQAGIGAPVPRACASGLDLGEDERPPVEGDEVDLTCARAHVAPQHGEAEPPEVRRGEILTEAAELPPPPAVRCNRRPVLLSLWRLLGEHARHARGTAVTGERHL
jgi:CoA-transferase family III